jgi:hypothetical protein
MRHLTDRLMWIRTMSGCLWPYQIHEVGERVSDRDPLHECSVLHCEQAICSAAIWCYACLREKVPAGLTQLCSCRSPTLNLRVRRFAIFPNHLNIALIASVVLPRGNALNSDLNGYGSAVRKRDVDFAPANRVSVHSQALNLSANGFGKFQKRCRQRGTSVVSAERVTWWGKDSMFRGLRVRTWPQVFHVELNCDAGSRDAPLLSWRTPD